MSTPVFLEQHLQRLKVPHPAVQQAVVVGVFDALAKTPGLPRADRDAAVEQCLACDSKAAVEAAVLALLPLASAGASAAARVQDQLLAALSTAGSHTVPVLADALLQLFEGQLQPATPVPPSSPAPAGWRTHPLSKALLSSAGAGQPLVLGVARLLMRAAEAAAAPAAVPDAAVFERLLAQLRPFLSFVLLDSQLAAQHPLMPPQLRSTLARVACCTTSPAAQAQLLQFLATHLPALRLSLTASTVGASAGGTSAELEAAASAAVADVMDVVESADEDPDADTIASLAAHLVCLCYDAARAQAAALLQQLGVALARLAAYWPQLVLPYAADLGLLLQQQPRGWLGGGEAKALMALLGQLLQQAAGTGPGEARAGSGGQPQPQQLAALLLLPLLQEVAFSNTKFVKHWAAHLLALLVQVRSPEAAGPSVALSSSGLHGSAAAARAAQQLLQRLWGHPLEAHHWLASLQLTLAAAASSNSGATSGRRATRDQQQLDGGVLLIACALLQHPAQPVQRASLHAALAALAATPLLGLSLLPLLVQQLQGQVKLFLSGKCQRPPRLLLDLLRALPAAGRHPAALPFVLRTLQPLLSAGAPEVLQAAGLRLLCRLWRCSGGRAYPQLRAAIIGFAAPGQQPGLALRVSRAECLRDVATSDPDKAVELVGLIQESLADEAPAVQAAALDCVALLCEANVLEFYAAWHVVHRAAPRLPDHPAAAAAWVRLLGCGALDAAVQPQPAAAIIDALWLAAAHEAPQVRRQAYASLAAFQFGILEEIGALCPLDSYAALLRAELRQPTQQQRDATGRVRRAAAHAMAECEALVRAALAHEHATRRRPAAAEGFAAGPSRHHSSTATGASGGAAAPISHRIQSVLPSQLLGGSLAAAADLLARLPEVAPAAVLFFYAPPPPSEGSSKTAAAAARQAAAAYQAVFAEVVRQQAAPGSAATEDARTAAEALPAWSAFLRRWMAGVRAASRSKQTNEQQKGQQQVATDAALQVWEAVKQQLEGGSGGDSTPAAAANAAWAAAALCCCTPQPLPALVTAVHGALRDAAAPAGEQPAAVKRAALAALGATAESVRVALGPSALQELLKLMQQQLHDLWTAASGAAAAAAAATGLGLACSALSSSTAVAAGGTAAPASGGLPAAAEQPLREGLSSLLSFFCTAWPAGGSSIGQAAASCNLQLPPVFPALAADVANELLPPAGRALAVALPPAAATLPLAGLLQQLHQQVAAAMSQQPLAAAGSPAAAAALCTLLQASAAAGCSAGVAPGKDVSSSLCLLLSVAKTGGSHEPAGRSAAAADGQVVGSAAAAAGTLLASALRHGFTPSTPEEGPTAVLQLLLAVPDAAVRLPHAAAAKQGAAAGIAVLLTEGVVDLASPLYKTAVGVLEGLALRDSNPRARRACAAPLAALCYASRCGGGGGAAGGSASHGAAAGGSRGFAQLPPDGALRPLLESLLEGRWVLPGDEDAGAAGGQELAAADAAAILRCVAAAERLPGMNYSAVCRRLLRTFNAPAVASEEVQHAVVSFVADQGARQQQHHHLADLAAELVGQRCLAAAAVAAQRRVLLRLPQLQAALPESQAVGALHAVCQYVAAAPASQRLLLPLLHATEQLLCGTSATSTGLRLAAQQAMAELLLPLLPAPGQYPLHLTAALTATDSEEYQISTGCYPDALLSMQQRCWAAALRCLQLLPRQQLEGVLQQPLVLQQLPLHAAYATAALVANGALEGRALQHPRNLLLAAPGGGSGSGSLSWKQQGLVAAFVGRAVATLPEGQQQQWLLDVLEACGACASVGGALQLAAAILASSAAAAGATDQIAADHISTAGPSDAAVHSLPFTLPVLLASPAWQHGASAALLLQRLSAALHAAQEQSISVDNLALLRRCLLAARHYLPLDMWQQLASLL